MKPRNMPKLTRSVRRHIRGEKALIRRGAGDRAQQAQKIAELYAKFGVVIGG